MRRKNKLLTSIAIAGAGVLGVAMLASGGDEEQASPPSTAFTYQGRLLWSGEPYDGLADLTFKLFNSAAGANQIGLTLFAQAFDLVEGLFAIDLDFGEICLPIYSLSGALRFAKNNMPVAQRKQRDDLRLAAGMLLERVHSKCSGVSGVVIAVDGIGWRNRIEDGLHGSPKQVFGSAGQ